MIRVLVAATSAVVRAGLEALVTANPALAVVGSSSGIDTLVQDVETLQPDAVLVDLEGEDEPALLGVLGTGPQAPAILVLSDDPQGEWASEALRSGVRAILPREATAAEIVAAVEAVAAGLIVLHPDAIDILLSALPPVPRVQAATGHQTLTPREVEVLEMLAEGVGNKTIARRLGISEHTVKFHVGSIFAKLHASSRTEAVTLGARQGLILL